MNYKEIMVDCASYIKKHKNEQLMVEDLGKLYSFKPEYLGYLFSCFYQEPLDLYMERMKEAEMNPDEFCQKPIQKRSTSTVKVDVKYTETVPFYLNVSPVINEEKEVYRPLDTAVEIYERYVDTNSTQLALWLNDENYSNYYMYGNISESSKDLPADLTQIRIPSGRYAIFSFGEEQKGGLAEQMKDLINYAQTEWMEKNAQKVDLQGYTFECIRDGKVYYCLALLEKEKEEPPEKVYGVDTWTTYIDENITGNLTTTSLAQKFHYSPTHFKRIFRCYYKMSVSDYIRKRRMTMIAEKIREGMNPKEAAALYHFKTYAGFARAFQKEFHVLPTMYSKGMFEVIDLAKYYFQNKDKIRMSIIKLQSIKMIGHTIIPCKKEEVDIPAQMNYWRGRAFPCLENTRFSSNVERREDKIALWYHEPESKNIDYILGPVVQEFPDKIPEKMIKVTLEEGKYAIFETDKISDERDITETLRMYIRCIFYGWVKEYRDRVDLKRITFERYVDCKIYFYVPVNH